MHGSYQDHLNSIGGFLGGYFLCLAAMNAVAAFYAWHQLHKNAQAIAWMALAFVTMITAPLVMNGEMAPFSWPVEHFTNNVFAFVDSLFNGLVISGPMAYIVGAMPLLAVLFLFRGSLFNPRLSLGTIFAALCALVAVLVLVNSKSLIDQASISGPVVYSVGTTLILAILFVFRRFFVHPVVAWAMLNLSLIAMGFSMRNPNFAAIVTKPDNVPIVGLMYLLGFFTWLATAKAVKNDDRIAQGLPPLEKLDDEKVLVWPDLVYTELICMIAVTALLLFWAIGLRAPLEDPASSVRTPNPSKAPWYFLGLQEMLVYYDPWMAGVVLPSLIVFGLMAIPFLDFNRKGNGYYSIAERKFSYLIFQFGFLEMWITLIILGTFFRGPNWNIFGPFEYWDSHKVLALNNVDLSQYFWVRGLHTALPKAPPGSGTFTEFFFILKRESPGILLLLGYFLILPPLLAMTTFRKFFIKMGFIRYMLMANLMLFMAALPLKMILRWSMNLKYIVSIPEYFLNF